MKTQKTLDIENALASHTKHNRIFGCFEVTIGWYGQERVDYLTMDYDYAWRCHEIKISKSDFYSRAKKTFCGHYNYYVMPLELFEIVKGDIPTHIGVKCLDKYGCIESVKRAKRQDVSPDIEKVLLASMIRSLCREIDKLEKNGEFGRAKPTED